MWELNNEKGQKKGRVTATIFLDGEIRVSQEHRQRFIYCPDGESFGESFLKYEAIPDGEQFLSIITPPKPRTSPALKLGRGV